MDYLDLGFNYTDKVKVWVPFHIFCVLENLASKMDDEYSIVLNAEKVEGGYLLSEEYRIPKQEVSTASIAYKEDCPEMCVIHRHPDGCNNFSGTDQEYINQNFALSLLYTVKDGVFKGQYNIKLDDNTFIRVPIQPVVVEPKLTEVAGVMKIGDKEFELNEKLAVEFATELYVKALDVPTDNIEKFKYQWNKKDDKRAGVTKIEDKKIYGGSRTSDASWYASFDTRDVLADCYWGDTLWGIGINDNEDYYYDFSMQMWMPAEEGDYYKVDAPPLKESLSLAEEFNAMD